MKNVTMFVFMWTMLITGCSSTTETVSLTNAVAANDPVQSETNSNPLMVLLVRHAEKADSSEDPELTDLGRARASALAEILRDAEIEHVHSSDYIRTKSTAAPTAAKHGLEVELYDARNLNSLVEEIRETGGRHLVVGHSNTTPTVVELLGGTPGSAINEPGEFDRLYIVNICKHGTVNTVLVRYGEPYQVIVDY